ncbi:kinase-like protein [Coprinellus micaceus]|uniref:Kinase-like protein n=1 Tax=Coprinellus micaceus TaxID=71717 RepID=A0A4Y7TJY1_COPMI|nr:kinase-like protein [Coprinellus micaceus]
MTRCSGCSRNFPALAHDARCGHCQLKKPRALIEEWGSCSHCGSAYEHLEGALCFKCTDADDGVVQAARGAIASPVNPRAHTGPDGRVSLSSRVHEQGSDSNQERRDHAARVLAHMGSGYAEAVGRAIPGMRISPSKLKVAATSSSGAIMKPVPRLNIKISRVTDHDKGRYRTGPTFHSVSTQIPTDMPASELAAMCWTIADNAYTKGRGRRVAEESFSILWSSSRTLLNSEWLAEGEAIGDLWRRASSNSLLVPANDVKRKVMDFHVVVQEEEDSEELDQANLAKKTYITRKGKRANSVGTADLHTQSQLLTPSDSTSGKKPRVASSGREAYTTTINRVPGTLYMATKAGYVEDEHGSLTWVEEDVPMKIIVEPKPFASGLCKDAHKMTIDGVVYAAKCYYDVGYGESVSKEDNLHHLKEEANRQRLASGCAQRFMDAATKSKISFYNLRAAHPFIVIIAEGTNKGHAWLVDTLISEHASVRKFSGTNEAGLNMVDLVGKTCDAYAHYSLYDSDCAAVFVDIQGTFYWSTTGHFLYMFDFMMHSCDGFSGLGDNGWSGINTFVQQHTCNSICKALELTSTLSLWKTFGPGTGKNGNWFETQSEEEDGDDVLQPPTRPPSSRSNHSMAELNEYKDDEDH